MYEILAHTETQVIYLWNKVVTKADIQKLAKEIFDISKTRADEKIDASGFVHRTFFSVYCDDDSTSIRPEPNIFDDDSHIYSRRVWAVMIDFKHIDGLHEDKLLI